MISENTVVEQSTQDEITPEAQESPEKEISVTEEQIKAAEEKLAARKRHLQLLEKQIQEEEVLAQIEAKEAELATKKQREKIEQQVKLASFRSEAKTTTTQQEATLPDLTKPLQWKYQ